MPILAYALLSMLLITALAAVVRKSGFRTLCPLCAGVALTWMGLLGFRAGGFLMDDTLPALLLGGTVVGALHALDRRIPGGKGAPLWWKTAFLLAGFTGAYGLIEENGFLLLAPFIPLAILIWWSLTATGAKPDGETVPKPGVTALTEQMKNCC